MNWNDYIDKSYEWMLICANDEGCVQAYGMPLDELRARIEDIAENAIIQNALGTDRISLESVVEPYLIANQYIIKGARGRSITQKGLDIVKEF